MDVQLGFNYFLHFYLYLLCIYEHMHSIHMGSEDSFEESSMSILDFTCHSWILKKIQGSADHSKARLGHRRNGSLVESTCSWRGPRFDSSTRAPHCGS